MRTKNRIRQCEEGRIWWERLGFKYVKARTGDAICPQNFDEIRFANDLSACSVIKIAVGFISSKCSRRTMPAVSADRRTCRLTTSDSRKTSSKDTHSAADPL